MSKSSLRPWIMATVALAALPPVLAGRQVTNVRVQGDSIAPGLHLLQVTSDQGPILAHSTVFHTADGAILIDTHAGQAAPLLRAFMDEMGVGRVGMAINTHWHPDHNDGNAAWRESGATIIAHENVRTVLSSSQLASGLTGPGTSFQAAPREPSGLPDVTFADSIDLYLGQDLVRVVHPEPSHTSGDAYVWIPSRNVLHLGDLYWPNRFPSVDTDNGGTAAGLAGTIAGILTWLPEEATVLSGHGPPTGKEALRRYHRMIEETLATVLEGLTAGLGEGEIIEAGLGQEWVSWSSPLVPEDQWIRLILAGMEG